jgi:probable rRNA maturation factor
VSIDINNETSFQVDEKTIADLARFVLDGLRIHAHAELSVILVDVKAMEQLHLQWMDEPGPTDVMAFPMDELRPTADGEEPAPGLLGDVVLCPEVAEAQAARAGHSTEEELHLLTTHGILHLLGYDHGDPDAEREMFNLQSRLLADWRAARGGRR